MSARYWVLIADDLIQDLELPDGLRLVEPDERDSYLEDDTAPPRSEWWLVEDDGAPASLEGKQVELTFTRSGGKIMIGSRDPQI